MTLFRRTRPPPFSLLRCVARTAVVAAALASTATVAGTQPLPQGTGREVIIDSVAQLDGWSKSTSRRNYYGTDYFSTPKGSGASVTYQPQVDVAGIYGVYYWLPEGNIQLTWNAPYTVHDADGDFTYYVDQRPEAGGTWKFLGNHRFATGTGGTITLESSANGVTLADAVKLGAPAAEELLTTIRRAYAHGARKITIPPGEYRSPNTLDLDGLDGLTLEARGVTFIKMNQGLAMATKMTNDLTVIGLSINYDPLPFTQGRIVAVNPDRAWATVQLSAGYPRPKFESNEETMRQVIFDPTLRLPTSQNLNARTAWEDEAAGILRTNSTWSADVGDIVTFAWDPKGDNFGITIAGANTTLKDVTLYTAPGMGLMNSRGEGNTLLDGFRVIPGPPPPGATEAPILSTTWDGIQFQAVRKGPTVRNSLVVNAGDDSMSIQGLGSIKVRQMDGQVVWADFERATRAKLVQPGDTLKQWMDEPGVKVSCLASHAAAEETCGIHSTYQGTPDEGIWAILLDGPAPSTWKAHTVITDVDRMGNGFRFENNTIHSSGRGLLLKANNGDIIGNHIMGSNSISVSTEAGFDSHTNAGGNLRIIDNDLTSALWSGGDGNWDTCRVSALDFGGSIVSRRLFPNITIERNRFKDVIGLNLNLRNLSNATVKDNVFTGSHQEPRGTKGNVCNIPQGSVISVAASDDVRFSGNTMDRIGPYSEAQFFMDKKSTNVTGIPLLIEHPYLGIDDGHMYSLTNRMTGRQLTPTENGMNVRQVSPSAQPELEWILENDEADSVRIRHGVSGKYLTAEPETSTTVTLTDFADSNTQRWMLLDAANGTAKIQSLSTGQLLSTAKDVDGEGAIVGQHPVAGTLRQSWTLTDLTP